PGTGAGAAGRHRRGPPAPVDRQPLPIRVYPGAGVAPIHRTASPPLWTPHHGRPLVPPAGTPDRPHPSSGGVGRAVVGAAWGADPRGGHGREPAGGFRRRLPGVGGAGGTG